MNNRRSFFKQLALGAASFAILPSASTYERIWKPKSIVPVHYEINPAWVKAEYEVSFYWNTAGVMEKEGLIVKRKPSDPPLDGGQYPLRFVLDNDKLICVHRFTEV